MSWKSIIILERQMWLQTLYAISIAVTISQSSLTLPIVIQKSRVSELFHMAD
jgi:hypothetical protein